MASLFGKPKDCSLPLCFCSYLLSLGQLKIFVLCGEPRPFLKTDNDFEVRKRAQESTTDNVLHEKWIKVRGVKKKKKRQERKVLKWQRPQNHRCALGARRTDAGSRADENSQVTESETLQAEVKDSKQVETHSHDEICSCCPNKACCSLTSSSIWSCRDTAHIWFYKTAATNTHIATHSIILAVYTVQIEIRYRLPTAVVITVRWKCAEVPKRGIKETFYKATSCFPPQRMMK